MTDTKATGAREIASWFRDARGVESDAQWASTAAARFALDDVRPGIAREALSAAAGQVRDSGESPEELYGPAREWARARQAEWRDGAAAALDIPEPMPWRDVVVSALVLSAMIAGLQLVVSMLRGEWRYEFGIGAILMIPVVGFGVRLAHAGFERGHRRSVLVGMAGAAAAIVAMAAVTTRGHDPAVADVWWLLAPATAFGVLAWLAAAAWPRSKRRDAFEQAEGLAGGRWAHAFARALRQRGDIPERRVRMLVAEARAHAADAGADVAEEFGNPAEYAASFPRDRRVRARREAVVWIASSALAAALAALQFAVNGFGPYVVVLGVWTLALVALAAGRLIAARG